MNWEQLLSARRWRDNKGHVERPGNTDLRSEFEKDYHRIIGSASFRRLQDKTQVFPLDPSDFVRTRLTHSLEVSSFGKSLGQNIGESILVSKRDPGFKPGMKEDICNVLQCAGLIHDIGNPPFGHFGEMAVREWFERNIPVMEFGGKPLNQVLEKQMIEDFCHFEGNAQALRLVSKLHFLVDEHGMNLTYALLNTIVKYPVPSVGINRKSGDIKDKKMGYYYADQELYRDIEAATGTGGNRHPLTFILEASDDIAYKTADVEDAFVKGFLSYHQLAGELLKLQEESHGLPFDDFNPADRLTALYERALQNGMEHPEEYAVKNWIVRVQSFLIRCTTHVFMSNYDRIMEGNYKKDLFSGTFAEPLMGFLGGITYREVFTSNTIYRMEAAESAVINFLMDRFMTAAVKYDDPGQEMSSTDVRMMALISANYKSAYHFHSRDKDQREKLYLRMLLVTDFICGMTDSYAKRLYQELNAII